MKSIKKNNKLKNSLNLLKMSKLKLMNKLTKLCQKLIK